MVFLGREKFLEQVNKLENTDVLYDKRGIVIIQVKSFDDCHELFDKKGIHWCIAQEKSHWDSYVTNTNSSQYFIIDFNKIDSDSKYEKDDAMVGFTLNRDGFVTAAHNKIDANLLNGDEDFKMLLKSKKLYRFVTVDGMKESEEVTIIDALGIAIVIEIGVVLGYFLVKFVF